MKDLARLSRLQQQVHAAWDKLPLDTKAKLGLKITMAHAHELAMRATSKVAPPPTHPPHRELLMLHSLLNDPNATAAKTAAAAKGLLTYVGADGEVFFGGVDYDSTDPGWAYCFPSMVFTEGQTPPFAVGNVVNIPDNTTIALLGDWGSASPAALSVAAAAKSAPYVIHLGDVYYAGTLATDILDDYEHKHLINVWPGVANQSFTLNSNHEMYAHATGYVAALASPKFHAQGGHCFALVNKAFRIVGLDSAYYAPDNTIEDFPGYMVGSLGRARGPQMRFLQSQISQLTAGQPLILLTHHNGLTETGALPAQTDPSYMLWQQVTQALQQMPPAASRNVVWYYGHIHQGVVYKPQSVGGVTIYPRCSGHGCIPWGIATELQSPNPNVVWFEKKVLGPGTNYFVTNGYTTLKLSGASLTEAFFDQNGHQSWSGTVGAGV